MTHFEHFWAARRGDLETIDAELARGARMHECLADREPGESGPDDKSPRAVETTGPPPMRLLPSAQTARASLTGDPEHDAEIAEMQARAEAVLAASRARLREIQESARREAAEAWIDDDLLDDDPAGAFLHGLLEDEGLDDFERSVIVDGQGPTGLWWPIVHAAASEACSDEAFEAILDLTFREGPPDPRQGATALHEAAKRGRATKVGLLVEAGADSMCAPYEGSSVLDAVPYRRTPGSIEALRLILESNPMDGEKRALLANQALGFGNRDALRVITSGESPLCYMELAEEHGGLGAALLYGLVPPLPRMPGSAEEAAAFVHVAVALDQVDHVTRFERKSRVVPTQLLTWASEMDACAVLDRCLARKPAQGALDEALRAAASSGAPNTTRRLLDAGARPDADCIADALDGAARVFAERGLPIDSIGADGHCLLRGAAESGDLGLARFLLDHGADPNNRDGTSWTPLHAAVASGWDSIAELLLERGADPSVEDLDGDLPVDLARSRHIRERLDPAAR